MFSPAITSRDLAMVKTKSYFKNDNQSAYLKLDIQERISENYSDKINIDNLLA